MVLISKYITKNRAVHQEKPFPVPGGGLDKWSNSTVAWFIFHTTAHNALGFKGSDCNLAINDQGTS